jgi:hypothetical protein
MGRRATITSARRIERERRTAAIMQMRLEGHSLRAIGEAQRPPVSGVAIFKTIRKAIERMVDEATEQIRRIESLRLDEMTTVVYPAASAGDLVAIDRMLDIMRRRARLLGLDTPVRWAPGVAPGAGDEFTTSQAAIEIVGGPDLERVRRLEVALEERGQPPRSTTLN